jgi:chromosome segregation ATPase
VVSAEVERLRAQHADAVREKSAADSKCRKLAEKVGALEGERTELRRQLAEERREANQALAKAHTYHCYQVLFQLTQGHTDTYLSTKLR